MTRRKAPFQSRVGIAEKFYVISTLENELWKKAFRGRFDCTNTTFEFSISLNLSKYHILRLHRCSGSGCSRVVTEYKRPAKFGGSFHKPAMTGATFPKKKRPLMRTELTQLVLKQIV